jgi:adenylate kinase
MPEIKSLPNIHILGIQGSGKGTQSALLVKKYSLSYVSSGNLFRARAAEGDAFGTELGKELHAGRLIPNAYLVHTIEDYLTRHTVSKGFLGDGVIRTLEQYDDLCPVWDHHSLADPLLIHLQLSEEEALARIAHRREELNDPAKHDYHMVYSGKLLHRTDDNPLAIKERFALFHKMTLPVITLFEKKQRCIHISADQTIDEIHEVICDVLAQYYPHLYATH